MRVAVTGTPGTGKTTATTLLESRLDAVAGDHSSPNDLSPEAQVSVVHLNDVIDDHGFSTAVDEDRDSVIADLEAIDAWLADTFEEGSNVVIESHLAHHFDADRVAVLRCRPEALADRLRERGESEAKARENAESEALDVILAEAVDRHGLDSVYEVDTTDRDPGAVSNELEAILAGNRKPSAGTVDYVDYLS